MNERSASSRRHYPVAILITIWIAVLVTTSPVGAHGVDVVAEFDDGPGRLELTDETGEVCLHFDTAIEPTDRFAIATTASGDVVLALGDGFGVEEVCQFLDSDEVDAVLADVDAHELIRRQSDGTVTRAELQKPTAPASETALATSPSPETIEPETIEPETIEPETADDDTGPNLPLVFAIGAAVGLGIALLRKRSRSRRS